jgi:phosphoglycolate phosphatase
VTASGPITDLFVFDLDGTLVDSCRDIAESANIVLESCGCAPHSEDAIGTMVGDGAAMLVVRAFEAANCPMPPDAVDRFLRVYGQRLLLSTRPYEGIPELLHALGERGTLAVLTNKPLSATRTILEGLGLAAHFGDRVMGGDGPLPRKPDPAGLLQLVSSAATTPERTLMVGDSVVDFRTAKRAGTRACVAMYGFGFHGRLEDTLGPDDVMIARPLDLMTAL